MILNRVPVVCEGVAIGRKDTSLPASKVMSERRQYKVNTKPPSELIPSSDCQNENSIKSTAKKLSPRDAAISMNSVEFLKELVRKKDTFDEKYYAMIKDNDEYHHHNHDHNVNLNPDEKKGEQSKEILIASVVEYTGRLWFMKKRTNQNNGGIQFQESVRIHHLSECGTSSTVECITKYKHSNTD